VEEELLKESLFNRRKTIIRRRSNILMFEKYWWAMD
jgi:hypothetical protein